MPRLIALLACVASGVLAGCGPSAAPLEAATQQALSTPTPTPQRFICDGGHRIELRDGHARVRLADGRTVALPVAGTGAYRNEALSFVITADRGALAQDEVGTFACALAG